MGAETTERRTLTITEAGRQLGVSRNVAYDLAARGELPTLRLGRRRLVVPIAAFERWLLEANRPVGATSGR